MWNILAPSILCFIALRKNMQMLYNLAIQNFCLLLKMLKSVRWKYTDGGVLCWDNSSRPRNTFSSVRNVSCNLHVSNGVRERTHQGWVREWGVDSYPNWPHGNNLTHCACACSIFTYSLSDWKETDPLLEKQKKDHPLQEQSLHNVTWYYRFFEDVW